MQLTFAIAAAVVVSVRVVVVVVCRRVNAHCYSSLSCQHWHKGKVDFGGDSAFAVAVGDSSRFALSLSKM